jgi:hypothetical protein
MLPPGPIPSSTASPVTGTVSSLSSPALVGHEIGLSHAPLPWERLGNTRPCPEWH